jgi:hypothetical protein
VAAESSESGGGPLDPFDEVVDRFGRPVGLLRAGERSTASGGEGQLARYGVVGTEHVDMGPPDQQLAPANRIDLHRGTEDSAT